MDARRPSHTRTILVFHTLGTFIRPWEIIKNLIFLTYIDPVAWRGCTDFVGDTTVDPSDQLLAHV